MLKLIMGLRGSGKTKKLVDMVNEAVSKEDGAVVCIEKDKNLVYDIPYSVRLIHAAEYSVDSNAKFMGFVYGVLAGNYDITHIFIDNFFKMLSDTSDAGVSAILDELNAYGEKNNVSFTVVASADPANSGESVTKYL